MIHMSIKKRLPFALGCGIYPVLLIFFLERLGFDSYQTSSIILWICGLAFGLNGLLVRKRGRVKLMRFNYFMGLVSVILGYLLMLI